MPTEIADGVHDITCLAAEGRRIRAYLFEGDPPTLVDAGLPNTADALLSGIDETGTIPERIVLTHGDGDHVGGVDAVVEAHGAELWVPEGTALDTDADPDERFGDGDRVGRFVAVHLPGHEPDNHALVDGEAGIAVMGDAASGADQRGLPAGHFHLPPAVYSADLNQAEESLARLLEYEFDVALVFHGSSITEDAGAKLERYVNFPGKP